MVQQHTDYVLSGLNLAYESVCSSIKLIIKTQPSVTSDTRLYTALTNVNTQQRGTNQGTCQRVHVIDSKISFEKTLFGQHTDQCSRPVQPQAIALNKDLMLKRANYFTYIDMFEQSFAQDNKDIYNILFDNIVSFIERLFDGFGGLFQTSPTYQGAFLTIGYELTIFSNVLLLVIFLLQPELPLKTVCMYVNANYLDYHYPLIYNPDNPTGHLMPKNAKIGEEEYTISSICCSFRSRHDELTLLRRITENIWIQPVIFLMFLTYLLIMSLAVYTLWSFFTACKWFISMIKCLISTVKPPKTQQDTTSQPPFSDADIASLKQLRDTQISSMNKDQLAYYFRVERRLEKFAIDSERLGSIPIISPARMELLAHLRQGEIRRVRI